MIIGAAKGQGYGFKLAEPALAIYGAFDVGEWTRTKEEDPSSAAHGY